MILCASELDTRSLFKMFSGQNTISRAIVRTIFPFKIAHMKRELLWPKNMLENDQVSNSELRKIIVDLDGLKNLWDQTISRP